MPAGLSHNKVECAPVRRLAHSFRLRPVWVCILVSGLGLVAAGPVRAQVIDKYLNADIPGFGTDPGVTVTSRGHPEYDPAGVRVGIFTISPSLDEGFGYDDNVTSTASAHGSAVVETNAKIGVAADWGVTTANAALSVDDSEYLSQSDQSFTNWSAALGGSHDFGRDVLSVGVTHLNLNQTPGQLDVPNLTQSLPYRVDDARGDYKIDFGRLFLLPGIDVSNYSFDNGVAAGVPYLQSYRDRVVVSPSLEASYEFATRRRIVLVLRDTQADFSHSVAAIPRQNFNDVSVLGGLAYDADGIIGFRLLGGYEERHFSSSAYRTIQAPIVESSIVWTPTGLTTITGTAARYIEDSASENTVGFTETALKLKLDHELYRNILLNAQGSLFLDDYAASGSGGSGGSQSYYTLGLGATWLINRTMSLTGGYTFAARNAGSNVPVAFVPGQEIFGSNYTDSVFMLRLRFGL
jgi:hypothetical protein